MHKLRNRNTFVPDQYKIPGSGDPIERNRQVVRVNIDRSVFHKSKKDKEILKLAKLQSRLEELKHGVTAEVIDVLGRIQRV